MSTDIDLPSTSPEEQQLVLGVKMHIGTGMVGNDDNYQEWLNDASIEIEDFDLEANPMVARYYNDLEGDEDSGYIYWYFKTPIHIDVATEYFFEPELILKSK